MFSYFLSAVFFYFNHVCATGKLGMAGEINNANDILLLTLYCVQLL